MVYTAAWRATLNQDALLGVVAILSIFCITEKKSLPRV